MVVYQLIAHGSTPLGTRNKIHSKRVFRTREKATEHIDSFKTLVQEDREGLAGLSSLAEIHKVFIVELELDEDGN